jgi:iron complex transport system substrate-binding protein
MRVVSLLPAGTEIVAALGGADRLVGISHECDYPPAVLHLPRVTATPIDASATSAALDAEVRRLRRAGRAVIGVDAEQLAALAPDVLLTQGLCEVCAVAEGEVHRLTAALRPPPLVVSLSAGDLAGIWGDIRAVGRALDLEDEADELVTGLGSRLGRLRTAPPVGRARPRVLCVEWLAPLFLAAHWVPELVEAAGAEAVGAEPGEPSAQHAWREAGELRPDLVLVMLCGFGVERSRRELRELEEPGARAFLRSRPTWILDGNSYTSRPGPRVVDGAERIRGALEEREMSGLERWQEW